jgi:hypothetical protein
LAMYTVYVITLVILWAIRPELFWFLRFDLFCGLQAAILKITYFSRSQRSKLKKITKLAYYVTIWPRMFFIFSIFGLLNARKKNKFQVSKIHLSVMVSCLLCRMFQNKKPS